MVPCPARHAKLDVRVLTFPAYHNYVAFDFAKKKVTVSVRLRGWVGQLELVQSAIFDDFAMVR